MNDARRVMIIGAGDLGGRVLHELAHSPQARRLHIVGRTAGSVTRTANMVRFCSVQRGFSTVISHAAVDVRDVEATAEAISQFAPDVIFLAITYQSWWVISTLPSAAYQRLNAANFGPWLPMHLVPVMRAMEAVRLSGTPATVVNAAYPDAVHPVLSALGLAPHIGIGNVANNVPAIRAAIADQLQTECADIEVRLVAHHYVSHRLSRFGDSGGAEMALSAFCRRTDITNALDVADILRRLPVRYPRTGGLAGQAMTAASALSVLEPLLDGRTALVHAPGPLGLPGGYPVAMEAGSFRLALPPGLTEEAAVAINNSGQKHDGIAEILPNGTVVFEERAVEVMKRELGYECPMMPAADAENWANELTKRFAEYRRRQATA